MDIVSTMGSGQVGRELDLPAVVEALEKRSQKIHTTNFSNPSLVTIRLEAGGPAITVYRTGAFQIRGARNKSKANKVKNEFLNVLDDIGVKVEDSSFELKTAVFMDDLNQTIDLETLAITLGLQHVDYEPEQFPGLIYHSEASGATLNIFSSGKVLILGTTNTETARRVLTRLSDALEESTSDLI